MSRVLHGVVATVFLWWALIENGAIRCEEQDVGFEPRDSKYKMKKVRTIEVPDVWIPRHMTTTTLTPIELIPIRPEVDRLCESCSECFLCLWKPQNPTLPPTLWEPENEENKTYLLFHSFRGSYAGRGLYTFLHEGLMDKVLWRTGLKPLRIFVERCTLLVSLFVGVFPPCGCGEEHPKPYQVLIGGLDTLFHEDYIQYGACEGSSGSCLISVKPPMRSVWVISEWRGGTLIQRSSPNVTVYYVSLPSFELTLSYETVKHFEEATNETIPETFLAFSRAELYRLLVTVFRKSEITYYNKLPKIANLDDYMIEDLWLFLGHIINGTVPRDCYLATTTKDHFKWGLVYKYRFTYYVEMNKKNKRK